MMIQNGKDMVNLTRACLKYTRSFEEKIMHKHLSELKHPQIGSIIGYDKAIQAGLLPFIPSEIFKIGLAVAIIPTIQKYIHIK